MPTQIIKTTKTISIFKHLSRPHTVSRSRRIMEKRIDIDKPRWDQSTYEGRVRHFSTTVNPLHVFASNTNLENAKRLVEEYRAGREPAGTTVEEVWKAKSLYDSAYHPETGEKVFLPGRMSSQVPGNMLITGCMLVFYKSTPAVVLWQWINQSFNAIVNYCNRNASAGVTNEQLGQAYAAATTASVLTAIGLNKAIAASPKLSTGMVGRFVPMVAVAAANCVNIPLMRQQEIKHGINVMDEQGNVLGQSKAAAVTAVSQVVPSRVLMAAPSMFFPPLIMAKLEKTAFMAKNPWVKIPATLGLVGLCLAVSTPLCCALFPQQASITVDQLEPDLHAKARQQFPKSNMFFYNKGL